MDIHPVADIFPPMTVEQYAALMEDIRLCGLREPVWLWRGQLIDGRHRMKACEQLGVELRTQEYTGDDPARFVVSLNLHRRHLSESQRAMVAANLANLGDGQTKVGAQICAASQEDAAYLLNISRRSVQNAVAVKHDGVPELVAAVQQGVVSVSAAAEAVELDADTQRAIVDEVMAGRKPSEVIREYKPHVANNSGNNEWYTPDALLDAARQVIGEFDVDPASSDIANMRVRAKRHYTEKQDGLVYEWHGSIWMNPPYSQPHIAYFSAKLAEEVEQGRTKRACVLVNNATETAWFQTLLRISSAVCFLSGRVRFLDPSGNPGAPLQGQALLYVGEEPKKFGQVFAEFGAVLYA